MSEFTPISATIGGLLIGAAAAMLLLGSGRIAGISGIFGHVLGPAASGRAWRIVFLVGLPVGAAVWRLTSGGAPEMRLEASFPLIVGGGLLVGVGTQLGNGCTSGHGVCGVSRGSVRAVAATVIFMATGVATVALVRVALGG